MIWGRDRTAAVGARDQFGFKDWVARPIALESGWTIAILHYGDVSSGWG